MIQNISVEMLHPHPDNPRVDLGDLTELTESIKARGVMQNLTVVPWFSSITGVGCDDPKQQEECGYTVVIGHRRLAAAKLAGLAEVPCVVSDMPRREQVGVMLLENIQRTDLTILEQAKGFQMMIDFGDSITEVSEKTGFSETTVRHRVKLNELDPGKLSEAMERSPRIEDYVALEKIKDVELRNEVLESVGTGNFNWNLQAAVEKEEMPERRERLIEFLREWAEELEDEPKNAYNYEKNFYKYSMDGFKKPDDSDSGDYVYYEFAKTNSIYLYKQSKIKPEQRTEDKKVSAEELAYNERLARAREISARAYELRREFVINFTGGKKHAKAVARFAMAGILYGMDIYNFDEVLELLKIDWKNEVSEEDLDDLDFEDKEDLQRELILKEYEENPERTMLLTVWNVLDSNEAYYRGYFYSYVLEHEPNSAIDMIYDGLTALGYEMSEDEQGMRDGTHEVFEGEKRALGG